MTDKRQTTDYTQHQRRFQARMETTLNMVSSQMRDIYYRLEAHMNECRAGCSKTVFSHPIYKCKDAEPLWIEFQAAAEREQMLRNSIITLAPLAKCN